MKLKTYDVTITLSVPRKPETELKMILRDVPREKILAVKVPLKGLLEQFEAPLVDLDDGK